MRQPLNAKRGRGRGRRGNNGGSHNHVPNRNTSYESNGPDVKLRGNAQQLHEKYMALAHDAATSGERISAEAYTQFADHYFRLHQAAVGVAETKRQQEQANVAVDDGEAASLSKSDNEPVSSLPDDYEDAAEPAVVANVHNNAHGTDVALDDAGVNSAAVNVALGESVMKKRRVTTRNGVAKNGSLENGAGKSRGAKNGVAKPADEDRANLSPAQLAEAVQSDQDSEQVS